MILEPGADVPALPPTVAEWEDLLVRLEIMPRALRATLDGGDEESEELRVTLGGLVRRERRVGEWLESAAAGAAGLPGETRPQATDARSPTERFSAVRARNFAMVQRRGVEVWEWTGLLDDGRRVTVYQLLSRLVQLDGEALAEIRGALRRRPVGDEVSAC